MSEYKDTLNLPKTDFPMKANLAQREPDILKKWEHVHLYKKMRELNAKNPSFILHDGPPYANGQIHVGHVVNKVLKDIVTKSKTLGGFDAAFVPGWDCHGLPIELNVEKKIGKPGHKVTAAEFRSACRKYAMEQVEIQKEGFKRLGVLADWEHPYLTMDFTYEADIVRSLAKIIKNGHIQKGERPVYWCLDCCSALAEAEVEYADKTSYAVDVSFKVLNEAAFLACFKTQPQGTGSISIPIWTTTPWTLPSNQAVCLNPYLEYALIQCHDNQRLLIAESLVESVLLRYGIDDYRILGKTLGSTLEKQLLKHPFYDRDVPVVLAEFVTVETGTGAVHIAAAHGQDDFMTAKTHQLPMISLVGDDGCFAKNTPLVGGMHVNKVNDLIIEELKAKHALLAFSKMTHSYPHCWRHKTPLIFRATPQWFISMEKNKLREMALVAIENVHWIPEWGQNRIFSMIENRPDWCISRQRTWGVPIALFLHKETGEMHADTVKLMEEVAKRIEKSGVDAWFDLDAEELLGADAKDYKKCTDTLDVWFDSGVSSECILKTRPELGYPADLYLEGSDQHRGWFNSSLLTALAIDGHKPYKTVLTHGYVMAAKGQKMSKSKGNAMSPDEVIKTMGADVLRLWVSSIDYRGDIFVSDEILTRTSETYRRLRNTSRFLLANLEGFDPKQHKVKPENMLALDRWVVDKARLLQKEIIEAYDAYQFHLIYQKIHQFCSIELGSFYLDIIKDRQYTTQTNSLARRSTQTAMYHIIEALVRWMAPILSFTAEEIWQFIPGERNESVFLNTWYEDLAALPKDADMSQAYWENLRLIRDAVNKNIEVLRNEGKLGAPLEAAVHLYCEDKLKQQLDKLGDELRFLLITSSADVHLKNSQRDDVMPTDVPGMWLSVEPLSYKKCERCWHRRADVGENPAYPTLCLRCVDNVTGAGELRKFV